MATDREDRGSPSARDGRRTEQNRDSAETSDRKGPLWDAGYGALLTLALSVIPFSPVAGGVASGFRSDGGYLRGLATGLLAGVFAALPLAVLLVPALRVVSWLGVGISPSSPAYDVFLALVVGLFLAYTVGLSVVGGAVGVWARRHTAWNLDPARWL